jgi:hypothetical protein
MKPAWMTDEEYTNALEAFLRDVAKELGCLPSYVDPYPQEGNAHIMRKLRKLTKESKP